MGDMKKIKLFYWKKSNNFGDALSPYVVHRLSGRKIIYREKSIGGFIAVIRYVIKNIILLHPKMLFKLRYTVKPYEKHLLAIGSILQTSCKWSQVWGAGFMNARDHFRGGEVFAVRGKYSDMMLQRMGYKGCNVYGDPALLMPLLYKPNKIAKYKIGIIPHWSETEFFKALYADKYKVIDLRTTDVEQVIDDVCSCERIVSTSLHGIIISHAYSVPALWISNCNIGTDGTKFFDYFSSVDIHQYAPFRDFDEIIRGGNYESLFKANSDKTLPAAVTIKTIQKNLLKVAPFPLVDEFKKYITE